MLYKKIYFVGIKGVGMASLAVISKQAGFTIAGSDIEEEFITDEILKKEGIVPFVGFNPKNFDNFIQNTDKDNILVVTTAAHGGFENPETKYARDLNIKVLTHGQAVGYFMKGELFDRHDFEGISVLGSHGKTTISAMLAVFLSKLGLNPSYAVGTSEIFPIGSAGHYGSGNYFVAEADEYVSDILFDKTPKIFYQYPKIAIINNIDFDHPDFYQNIDDIKDVFLKFINNNIDKNGILIFNGDDQNLNDLKNKITNVKRVISYGSSNKNDFYISKYSQSEFCSYFSVESKNIYIGDFKLNVPGFHNAKNALSNIALLTELGIPINKISQILPAFLGTKRRTENKGKTQEGTVVIDDYAHHPQEIKTTLGAIKKIFPKKKIVCVFQPHTYSRTKALFNDFISAFYDADLLILLPIFASLREKADPEVSSEKLLEEFRKIDKNILFFKDKNFVIEYIIKNLGEESLVVTMGAGDVYKIASSLVVYSV